MRSAALASVLTITVSCPLAAQVRVFMAAEGRQHIAPVSGPTFHAMEPGETVRLMAWFVESKPPGTYIEAYQLIIQSAGQGDDGSVGQIIYVDDDPGRSGGDSILVNTNRDDWLYSCGIIAFEPVYNETPESGFFGVFYATAICDFSPCNCPDGIHYLVEFDLRASKDAYGRFEIGFLVDHAPGSAFIRPGGMEFVIDEFQTLQVIIGEPAPISSEPHDGAIDPRCTVEKGVVIGPDHITVHFDGTVTVSNNDEWSVQVTGDDESPVVDGVLFAGPTVTLQFDRPLPLGECTTITHLPTAWHTQIRSLPGDVSGDGAANPGDILTLIDHLNGISDVAEWQCDVNLSGVCNSQDILGLIDILNGATGHERVTLPECP